jgi:hypothetical protein
MTVGYRFTIFLSKANNFRPFDGEGTFEVAYEGRLASDDPLEDLFGMFNLDHPDDYKARSLSVGDLVALEVDGRAYVYACDPEGWRFVDSGVPELVTADNDSERGAA